MRILQRKFSVRLPSQTMGFLLFAAATVSGCGPAVTHVPADDHSDHDHEAQHLEHFVPAHKPRDFEALVQQLKERIAVLAATVADRSAESVDLQRKELSDVIGWLPELAAGSELRKQDFEKVLNVGRKLQAQFDAQFGQFKSQASDASRFQPLLTELEQLIPASKQKLL